MGMIQCPRCGANNGEDSCFCSKCGCRLQTESPMPQVPHFAREPKKVSSKLSIVAAIFSVFGCMCYLGLILAIIDLCIRRPYKKYKWSYFAIVACIIWTIIFGVFGIYGDDHEPSKKDTAQIETQLLETQRSEESSEIASEKKQDTETDTQKQDTEKNDTQIKKEKPKKQNKFVKALVKDGLDEKVAKKAYKILKKKIGFKKLKYVDRMDGLTNYNIEADGNDIVMTASDKVYRVFIPDSSYVFYEDGKVKLTAKELADKEIDYNDAIAYYTIAKTIVTENLKSPRSAHFPSFITGSGDVGMSKNGDLIIVQSYVDAENAFGASLRTKWTVQFRVVDLDSFSYETTYIKIGDQSYGSIEK